MSIVYERIVKQDLNLGHGAVQVTMPDGGFSLGDLIGPHTLLGSFYNVQHFGATGNGVTDDTLAIQAALDHVRSIGGGVLFFPRGTYCLSLRPHPNNSDFTVGLVVGSKTVIMGAGREVTILKLLANNPTVYPAERAQIITNYNLDTGGDVGIVFQDFTVDGNNDNQSERVDGIALRRVERCSFNRVTVRDIWGDTNNPGFDAPFYTLAFCHQVSYLDCQAIRTTTSPSAAGFHANVSSSCYYTNCTAVNLDTGTGFGTGFACWTCTQMRYTSCNAYLNGRNGLTAEFSEDVVHIGCEGGGQAPTYTLATTFPFTSGQSLGNGLNGFTSLGCTRHFLIGCVGRNNGGNGIQMNQATSARFVGCAFIGNGVNGIAASSTDPNPADDFHYTNTIFSGNSNHPVAVANGNFGAQPGVGPVILANGHAEPVPASGVDFLNDSGADCMLEIVGGTVTDVSLGTAVSGLRSTGRTSGSFRVPARTLINVTYSSTPAFRWWAED